MARVRPALFVSATAVSLALTAVAENPIVRMFPANVVYRQSFDDMSLIPDVGRVGKVQDPKTCEFASGELRAPALKGKDRFYQLDELAVLDRELTKDELLALYKETMKCRESK